MRPAACTSSRVAFQLCTASNAGAWPAGKRSEVAHWRRSGDSFCLARRRNVACALGLLWQLSQLRCKEIAGRRGATSVGHGVETSSPCGQTRAVRPHGRSRKAREKLLAALPEDRRAPHRHRRWPATHAQLRLRLRPATPVPEQLLEAPRTPAHGAGPPRKAVCQPQTRDIGAAARQGRALIGPRTGVGPRGVLEHACALGCGRRQAPRRALDVVGSVGPAA